MHVGQYRVRYRDVYSAGVVLNARYLDICDEAFTEFFRVLGFTSADLSAVPFDGALAHMDATFVSPSTVDDVLDVGVLDVVPSVDPGRMRTQPGGALELDELRRLLLGAPALVQDVVPGLGELEVSV